jgi:hypothetical protein
MTLTAGVTTAQQEGTRRPTLQAQQQQCWLFPRRTVSLGSSSEDLPGLLLNAMKREQQQEQANKLGAAPSTAPVTTPGAESPTRMSIMTSISSLSTSSYDSVSTSGSTSWLSLPPAAALVSPSVDRQAVHHMLSAKLPTIPLEGGGGEEVVADTTTTPDTSPTSPTTTTTNTTNSTTRAAVVMIVLRRKFSWKTHPVLEQYLLDHRLEYLAYSAKLNYTAEQKRYNNTLTNNLIALAANHGLVFDTEHFSFAAIRDRIRCFYKSHVQAAKKKKRKQQQQVNSSDNTSPVSLSKRKKIKTTAAVAPTAAENTAMLLAQDDDKHQVDQLNMDV